MWRNFRFFHICHVLKSEISPHDQFFLHQYIGDRGDKYEVWFYIGVHLWIWGIWGWFTSFLTEPYPGGSTDTDWVKIWKCYWGTDQPTRVWFAILPFRFIIFFMKKSHFLGEKGWDWDTPLPPHLDIVPSLSQVWPPFSCPFFRGSNKLLNWWDIAPPFMYYVFHHIYGQFQGKFCFGQF